MPRPTDPNSRTTPVTIKVTRTEADYLRRIGGTTGKGLRRVLAERLAGWQDTAWKRSE